MLSVDDPDVLVSFWVAMVEMTAKVVMVEVLQMRLSEENIDGIVE